MAHASNNTKAKLVSLIMVGILILIACVSSIYFLIQIRKSFDRKIDHSASVDSVKHEVKVEEFSITYEVKDMSMGLLDKKGVRTAYALFTLVFDCPKEETKEVLKLNHAKLIDSIFEVGGDFYLEDFSGVKSAEGFKQFKNKLIVKLQGQYGDLSPKSVVIKEWILN